jgi:Acyl-coenzyme A synthetases/AMP-(fatty) acid ligases
MSATETWTYGETVRRTNQLARVLTEDFALRPGNRVMLRGPNTPWLAAAWLAVIRPAGSRSPPWPCFAPGRSPPSSG